MKTYVGIDLGTTNSAICTFDGRETTVWKSPEQSEVTPSAIYVDRRGHHVFGQKAVRRALNDEKNAAALFSELGINYFSLKIYDSNKKQLLESRNIEITRIFASIHSVPASHSIALKVLDAVGGKPVPLYLVKANDSLPKSGSITLHAAEQLVGNGSGALSFSLWEGEIREPVDDNRYIGTYRIPASEIGNNVIRVGAVIDCDYEMNESGSIRLGASIPSIGLHMESRNFYSRLEGQIDLEDTASLVRETNRLLERTALMKERIVDEKLSDIRLKLVKIRDVFSHSADSEAIADSEEELLHCYRDIAILSQKYASIIRTQDLQNAKDTFQKNESYATSAEKARFNNYVDLAHYAIEMGTSDFEDQMNKLYQLISGILWRNEKHIRNVFMNLIRNPANYSDRAAFDRLRAEGLTALENSNMDLLKEIISSLLECIIPDKHSHSENVSEMFHNVNVYR